MAKELNLKQELVGCYGFPVAENPTQAMFEPAFRALNLDWRYLTLDVRPENLAAPSRAREGSASGASRPRPSFANDLCAP